MKAKKRKKRISRVPYSRLLKQEEKETRKRIRSCNAEEKEKLWQRIEEKLEERGII